MHFLCVVPYNAKTITRDMIGQSLCKINDLDSLKSSLFNIPLDIFSTSKDLWGGCSVCKKTYIPYGITEIGAEAFYGCAGLRKITFADEVFRFSATESHGTVCRWLKELVLPPSIKKIAARAFSYCKALNVCELPEGITEIEEEAFAGCSELEQIVLQSTLQRIGDNAFTGTKNQRRNTISLPINVSEIGKGCSWMIGIDSTSAFRRVKTSTGVEWQPIISSESK